MDKKTMEGIAKEFLAMMETHALAKISFTDGCGNSATLSKDKHGFVKFKCTNTEENLHE